MTSVTAPGGPRDIPSAKSLRPGFTLVEVLITVAVIAFGCLAALLMQSTALRGNTMADHMTVATFLAESEMERLQSLTLDRDDMSTKFSQEVSDWEADKRSIWMDRMNRICPSRSAALCAADYPYELATRFFREYPIIYSTMIEVEVKWQDNTGEHSIFNASIVTDMSRYLTPPAP
jgi:prepilin-type N-terminal cleavage/methylation domain-containing protein